MSESLRDTIKAEVANSQAARIADLEAQIEDFKKLAAEAKAAGNEDAYAKLGKFIAENQGWIKQILDLQASAEKQNDEADSKVMTAEETTGPAQEEQAKPVYTDTYINENGVPVTISSDDPEKLAAELQERNTEASAFRNERFGRQ